MHLVIDTLVSHELDILVTAEAIAERPEEWHRLTSTPRCHADYIKGIAEFMGLDLITYAWARVHRDLSTQAFRLEARSKLWVDRQPGQ